MAEKRYTLAAEGPRIEQFLEKICKLAGFSLKYAVSEGETPHPDFENPDLLVRFTGPDHLKSEAQGKIAVDGLPLNSGKNGKLRKTP